MFRILLFAQELLPGVKVRLDFGPGTVPFHENNGAEDYWVLSKYYGAEKYEAEDYNDTVDEAEMPGHQILVSLVSFVNSHLHHHPATLQCTKEPPRPFSLHHNC